MHLHAPGFHLPRFALGYRRGKAIGRKAAEVAFNSTQQVVGRKIANCRDHRVARPVVLLVMPEEVVPGHRAQVGLAADHPVAIGMHAKRLGFHRLHQPKHGRGFVPLALRDDDRPLRFHVFRIKHGVEHAVGLDLHCQVQMLSRHRFVVSRSVFVRERVERAAHALHHAADVPRGQALGTLEHHVLDPVRSPAHAVGFVPCADAVPDEEGCNGGGVHLAG